MKKYFIIVFAVLLLASLTGLPQAAQKQIDRSKPVEATLGPDKITHNSGNTSPVGEGVGMKDDKGDLGQGVYRKAGCLWYTGNSDTAYCINGTCNFGQGLRTYFKFKFGHTDNGTRSMESADGFVFAVLNASGNTDSPNAIPNRCGGAPDGVSIFYQSGELMGYACPGNTLSMSKNPKLGLVPPKMGIEFDIYPNCCYAGVGHLDSRNDPPQNKDFRNHIALMFWGEDDPPLSGTKVHVGHTYPLVSYDDNRHGAGKNSATGDPAHPDPSSGYYANPAKPSGVNWMEDEQVHSARIEIYRSKATNNKGVYTTKVWIDCNGGVNCADTLEPYQVTAPQINRTETINPANHGLMDRILFGMTQATGDKTQHITFTNWVTFFIKTSSTDGCGIAHNTVSLASAPAAGFCKAGWSNTAVTGSGPWAWTCTKAGQPSSSCWALP